MQRCFICSYRNHNFNVVVGCFSTKISAFVSSVHAYVLISCNFESWFRFYKKTFEASVLIEMYPWFICVRGKSKYWFFRSKHYSIASILHVFYYSMSKNK